MMTATGDIGAADCLVCTRKVRVERIRQMVSGHDNKADLMARYRVTAKTGHRFATAYNAALQTANMACASARSRATSARISSSSRFDVRCR